jgi:riboflavin synthase
MFTGIIEALGRVVSVEQRGTNRSFWIESPLSAELKIDQSLSHEGVCLTVEEIKDGMHRVTAVEETLHKTNLALWDPGRKINMERCLQLSSRLDGHLVQGHVDTLATCINRIEKQGSWEFTFELESNPAYESLIVEKGSIALNGTSLTIFNVSRNQFSIAIIPYTFEHTSIFTVQYGSRVNIEFDIIGKYILRSQQVLNYS